MKFNKLIPELAVTDFEESLNFYVNVLGFKTEYTRKENKFAMIYFQGSQLMIQEVNHKWETGKLEKPFGRGINFQIETKKIKPILNELKKNNYPLFCEPEKNCYRQNNKQLY